MWKGGSEQQLMTPDPGESSGSGDEFQIVQIICFLQQKLLGPHSRAMFFCFFHTLPSKTPIFESFFGRWPARKALKSRCFS